MARLLAAMSGGVDSSVAAALMVREGHDVVGVTLKQWDDPGEVVRLAKGCSVVDAVADARRTADVLGFPHYTLNFTGVFEREVVEPFARAYATGQTPNPCVRCNELVRFGSLLDKAEALGFDGLVTGHYARVARDADGRWRLRRARDRARDQSYVLYALGQRALSRARFPLGGMESKPFVRELARSLGLPAWNREDSVDVCFVPEGRRPADVVAGRVPGAVRRGPVVDVDGRVVGEHRGLANFTIGQRRGLGLRAGEPLYVTAVDPARNVVVVGGREDLRASGLVAARARYVPGSPPPDGTVLLAAIRYHGEEHEAVFASMPDGFRLAFREPVLAVAPGQAVVLYDGDEVVGGGTIVRAL